MLNTYQCQKRPGLEGEVTLYRAKADANIGVCIIVCFNPFIALFGSGNAGKRRWIFVTEV
jgi:hypothetical protein